MLMSARERHEYDALTLATRTSLLGTVWKSECASASNAGCCAKAIIHTTLLNIYRILLLIVMKSLAFPPSQMTYLRHKLLCPLCHLSRLLMSERSEGPTVGHNTVTSHIRAGCQQLCHYYGTAASYVRLN